MSFMYKGIDCASRLTAKTAAAARAAGFDFAGRYLVPPEKYPKALTRAEADAITGAGLRILTVWETTANRAKQGGDAGGLDGYTARKCAENIGMPEGGIIYFAVDYDAGSADFPAIAAYLSAARAQTGPYEIGVYGSYRVVEAMHARLGGAVCKGFWQCVAWSGGVKSPNLTAYQSDWSGTRAAKAAAAKIGISVDLNECPDMDRAGIWDYKSAPAAKEPEKEEPMDIERLLDDMTPAQAYRVLKKAQEHAETLPAPEWGMAELTAAMNAGITDGTRPMAIPTRLEAALMAYRAGKTEGDDGK